MKISSDSPARRFGEAYPIGNGRIGAMIFGGIGKDRLLLSENTFFSGCASDKNNRPSASGAFRKMREQIALEQFEHAETSAYEFIGRKFNYGTNLPVGDLFLTQTVSRKDRCPQGEASPDAYSRSLNIRDGIAESTYLHEGLSVQKQTFISAKKNLLVHEVRVGRAVDIQIAFVPYCPEAAIEPHHDGFTFSTRALETMHSDGTEGVRLYGQVRVISDGVWCREELKTRGATYFLLCVGMCTDFRQDEGQYDSCKAGVAIRLAGISLLHHFRREIMAAKEEHIREMNELFDRSTFEVSSGDSQSSKMLSLLFHYGRYLLYSSSRSNSVLPAHLQGIWNDSVACRIGWTCDMHLDINTQMNYWLAEITGLSEMNDPLFSWIESSLVPQGRTTAKESYGLPGWTAEIVSNAWGFAAPYWAHPIAPCPGCGIWILSHMYEHYLFTHDREFLVDRAFPLMKEAVDFFIMYVFRGYDGFYRGGPAISPENSFTVDGKIHFMSHGSTFEISMIRELFLSYLDAVDLCPKGRRDIKREKEVRLILGNLLPYRICEDGTLAEWDHDYPAADSQHRHTSHLLGLYPFAQITPDSHPELAEAAAESIRKKLQLPEQWEDTGWARSLLVLYCARLYDGDSAMAHINSIVQNLLEPNGMVIHPPTRGAESFDNVYELDGNTGVVAGIAEMLLQSHNGKIRILPALPRTWTDGAVRGLKARGNITVSITWKNRKPLEVLLESPMGKYVTLCYKKQECRLFVSGRKVLTQEFFYPSSPVHNKSSSESAGET